MITTETVTCMIPTERSTNITVIETTTCIGPTKTATCRIYYTQKLSLAEMVPEIPLVTIKKLGQ